MVVGVGLLLVVGVHRMAPALFFVFFLLPLLIHSDSAEEEGTYFPDCPGMSCGNLGPLYFPFTNATRPECGLIKVGDCNEPTQKIQFQGGGRWYDTSVSSIGTVIHDQEFKDQVKFSSCDALKNLTLPISPFWSFRNITMFKCNGSLGVPPSTDFNYTKCNHVFHYNRSTGSHLPSLPSQCSVIQLPVDLTRPINADPFSFLTANISLDLRYFNDCVRCKNVSGQCRFYHNGTFQCVKAAPVSKAAPVPKIQKKGRSNVMVIKLALGGTRHPINPNSFGIRKIKTIKLSRSSSGKINGLLQSDTAIQTLRK